MADDLVERLREAASDEAVFAMEQDFYHEEILTEAAAALESLRAENARLTEDRDALVEGLEPFARPLHPDTIKHDDTWPEQRTHMLGEIRRAQDLLAKVKGGTDAR